MNTTDDSDVGYSTEIDLKYLDKRQEKTGKFLLCHGYKHSPEDKFTEYMKKTKSKTFTPCKKLFFGWTDEEKTLIHYRTFNF